MLPSFGTIDFQALQCRWSWLSVIARLMIYVQYEYTIDHCKKIAKSRNLNTNSIHHNFWKDNVFDKTKANISVIFYQYSFLNKDIHNFSRYLEFLLKQLINTMQTPYLPSFHLLTIFVFICLVNYMFGSWGKIIWILNLYFDD